MHSHRKALERRRSGGVFLAPALHMSLTLGSKLHSLLQIVISDLKTMQWQIPQTIPACLLHLATLFTYPEGKGFFFCLSFFHSLFLSSLLPFSCFLVFFLSLFFLHHICFVLMWDMLLAIWQKVLKKFLVLLNWQCAFWGLFCWS